MAKRESFVFYGSWFEAISHLPRDIQGEVLTAIIEYGLNGATTDNLKPIARAMLTMIIPQIEANNKRYENGKKGGRPPKDETEEKPNNNQTETKIEPNVNDNVYVNVNDISSTDVLLSETSQPHTESIDYQKLIDFFNNETKGVFGNVRYPLSEKTKGMVRARIREVGKDDFAKAIRIACNSTFLKGQNDRNFKMTFQWMIRPTNFEKILSGNYDNRTSKTQGPITSNEDFTRSVAEGIARANYEGH